MKGEKLKNEIKNLLVNGEMYQKSSNANQKNNRKQIQQCFYNGGLNCAETTMRLLLKHRVIDGDMNLQKMMSGFGGGMQRGLVCGAVCAVVAAIGMEFGRLEPEELREPSSNAVRDFLKAFEEEFGALSCDDLIKGYESKSDAMYKHCTEYIGYAVDLAEEILKEK